MEEEAGLVWAQASQCCPNSALSLALEVPKVKYVTQTLGLSACSFTTLCAMAEVTQEKPKYPFLCL